MAAEVAGPSYDENRRRAEARHADDSFGSWAHAAWLWVPVGGTATRIWEAQSSAERVFNIVMMPIARRMRGALTGATDRTAVLDRAHDYFPFTFASRDDRDAAVAALEREGVTGPELDRAAAALAA